MLNKRILLIIVIAFFAFVLRISGINWDNGYHFHPDERMLIMVTEKVHLFSQLNPDFFNYGSLPIYLLAGTSQLLDLIFNSTTGTYDGLLYVGRWLSTLTDMLVLWLVYKIALLLWNNKKSAMWSAFFYAIAFFPIQNSHFFVVDVYLNFFATLLLYLLLRYHEMPSIKYIIYIGIAFAAALTTKVSAIIFTPIIVLVILISHTRRLRLWKKLLSNITSVIHHTHDTNTRMYLLTIFSRILLFLITAAISAVIFMPYALLEFDRFMNDILLQTKMNSDPYIFPYTLQYVGTRPYLYYLKNIFYWGAGPAISLLAILGITIIKLKIFTKFRSKWNLFPTTMKKLTHLGHLIFETNLSIAVIFYLVYFVVIGNSAVKFMRYLLLLYPFIALLAGFGAAYIHDMINQFGRRGFGLILFGTYISISVLWTLAFTNIYSTPNTRIQATAWINQYIPAGSALAVEHWDDRVPIFDPGRYTYIEMTLYDQPDDDRKWTILNEKLDSTDYIVIASNRLYVPLQRLNDCNKYKSCFPITAQYYEDLFAMKRGFTKVAEFTSYPRLSFAGMNVVINDDTADESFTVYDHPKIIIFKKTQ